MNTTTESSAQAGVVADVVARLNRAVQCAAMYPEDHPSVRAAVMPLLESLKRLFDASSKVTVFVSRARLLVACDGALHDPPIAPWLPSRLAERGVASLILTASPAESPLLRLVEWLARPATDRSPPPDVHGANVTWRDYAHARFVDQAGAADRPVDAALVWQGMAHGLASDWLEIATRESLDSVDLQALGDDPAELATFIRNTLLSQEGTGVNAVASRITATGSGLASLPEPGRMLVRKKLATLVAELAPELRGQLLRVFPTDSADKLNMIAEVIDELPHALVLEVVQGIDISGACNPQPLLSLLSKLVTLSAEQPDIRSSLLGAVVRAGGSADLFAQEPDQIRQALELLLGRPVSDSSMPDGYRAQLDDLISQRIQGVACFDASRFYLPTEREHLATEIPKLALALLSQAPLHDDAPALLRRSLTGTDQALATRDVEFLAGLARVTDEIAHHPRATAEAAAIARTVGEMFPGPALIEALASLIEDPGTPLPGDIGILMRVAGSASAEALFERFTGHASGAVRDRMIELITHAEPGALKVALARLRSRGMVSTRTLLALLGHSQVPNGVQLAELFATDPDPALRIQAFKMLFESALPAPRLEHLVRRALDDRDARVADLAISEVRSRHGALGIPSLGSFLGRKVRRELDPVQRRAVDVLTGMGTSAAREALSGALRSRGLAWDARSRRVSRLIERVLEDYGDEASRAAARGWRRSLAGLISLVLRDRLENA